MVNLFYTTVAADAKVNYSMCAERDHKSRD